MISYYCEDSFIDVVLPLDEWRLDETQEWINIGGPGVDGIEFRIKSDNLSETVYAFYPIENEHIIIADSIDDLILKWKENSIRL